MKHVAIAALLLLIPMQAAALDTSELLGLVAMPLAVAAVSNVTGVPAGELSNLVATLNRANVPPTQVVQVIRYVPVAVVVEERPTFVQFVREEVDRGVVGTQLVTSIDQRLRTYDVTPQFITLREPATTFVVSDDYIVQPLIGGSDLLAVIAMPLAVAAVAEATGVPFSELSRLVAMLNQADVAPVQFVEVLRYAPVALVVEGEPGFVQFVHTQVVDEGVRGPSLVRVIEQRLRTFDVTPQIALVPRSEVTVVDQNFFPPAVRTRMAARRGHPHGGPPGQLKRAAGVQTGAEIVHGEHPAARVTPKRPEGRGGPRIDPPGQRKKDERSMSGAQPQGGPPPGHSKGAGQGGGKGKGKGKG